MSEFNNELTENSVDKDPFIQFSRWYDERPVPLNEEIGTSVLATSNIFGRPSARVVLVKEFNNDGFIFYTNYGSRKAVQISENPYGALLFYWPDVHREVRIEGKIEKVSDLMSAVYFSKRNRESQLSAWASEQSKTIPDRKYLDARLEVYRESFRDKPVPKPPWWGGLILIPSYFEFWQEGKNRLHDRISYYLYDGVWNVERLAP